MVSAKDLNRVAAGLDALRAALVQDATTDPQVSQTHANNRRSAENLAQYLSLRQRDIRGMQAELGALGLSSLGHAEGHVLATLDAVREAVASLAGRPDPVNVPPPPVSYETGGRLLERNAASLLGQARNGRLTRIMVTLPSKAATDPALVDRIVAAGAEVVRVNCAHDGPAEWAAMIAHVRQAERAHGRRVMVSMDLAGPKLRTGPIRPAPQVVHIRPARDQLGRTVAPARMWMTTEDGPELPPDSDQPRVAGAVREPDLVRVPVVDPRWLAGRSVGEQVTWRDTRGSTRSATVTGVSSEGCLAELADTTYLVPGTELAGQAGDRAAVAALPEREQKLTLHVGDELVLVPELDPVAVGVVPARIGCTLTQVFRDARVGHRVFLDDGKIAGVVESASSQELRVCIIDAARRGSRLGAAKGINLPDTELRLPALTDEDLACLPFVVEQADIVSLSFVRSPDDVANLKDRLAELDGEHLGMVLKVETVAGFENLPGLLFAAMQLPRVGVMIARGDLAVEAGYGRLAEIQEEILWLCEAAHVPVIWATQVLDTLARTGRPSRAEVTDAAMAGRAECVMLNKGPYVDSAVAFLDEVLGRMSEHQRKKSSLLRQLHAWDGRPGLPEDEALGLAGTLESR